MSSLRELIPTPLRIRLGRLRPRKKSRLRSALAEAFLAGNGIEIGALHNPLPVHSRMRVRYVDRMGVADLRSQYPELRSQSLVPVDVIDDGEKLKTFAPGSVDFVIANHFLEHTQDPIGTIKRFMEILRPGGRLYMAVPDKRWTFDIDRPVTPIDHLYRDFNEGPEWSRLDHFREWSELVNKQTGAAIDAEIDRLVKMDYSIHFHVWTQKELLEMLFDVQSSLMLPYELSAVVTNRDWVENICVLTRT